MTVVFSKKTKLECDQCGAKIEYLGQFPSVQNGLIELTDGQLYFGSNYDDLPHNWYRITHSEFSIIDPSLACITGDFCSLECMRDYIIAKIDERDNPKPIKFVLKDGNDDTEKDSGED